jgi:hypothetical protein
MTQAETTEAAPETRHYRTAAQEARDARHDALHRRKKAEWYVTVSQRDTDPKSKNQLRRAARRQSRIARALDFYAHALENGTYPWGEEHYGKPSPFGPSSVESAAG